MGRPLKGSVRERKGVWYASLPESRGSSKRAEHRFDHEEDARRWLNAAVAAHAAGVGLPSPESFQLSRRTKATTQAPAFAEVARRWRDMAYENLRRGQPERARRIDDMIRLHVNPWFGPRTSSISDLAESGHQLALDFVMHLAGRQMTVSGKVIYDDFDSGRELSIVDAAAFLEKSPQTIRRHRLDGRFPNSRRDETGKVWIPVFDLKKQHLRRNDKKAGLAKSYANDILWTLRQIVKYAITNGWLQSDTSMGITTVEPDAAVARTVRSTERPRPWTQNALV